MCLECGTLCDDEDQVEVDASGHEDGSDVHRPEHRCVIEELTSVPGDESRAGRSVLLISGPDSGRSSTFVVLQLGLVAIFFVALATALVHLDEAGLALLTLPSAVVALVFVYMTRVPDVSRSVVTMGDAALVWTLRPFPWRKRYLSRRFVRRLDARASFTDGAARPCYEVVAVLQSDERMVLLAGLTDPNPALDVTRRMRERWE